MNAKSIFYGFITGCLAGGAITVLVTPKSGSEMQQLMFLKLNNFKNTLVNVQLKTTELKEQIQHVASEGIATGESVTTFSDNIKDSLSNWKNDVEPTVTDLQKSIQDLHYTIDLLEKEIRST